MKDRAANYSDGVFCFYDSPFSAGISVRSLSCLQLSVKGHRISITRHNRAYHKAYTLHNNIHTDAVLRGINSGG